MIYGKTLYLKASQLIVCTYLNILSVLVYQQQSYKPTHPNKPDASKDLLRYFV